MQILEGLILATGFTGAMTLVWLFRLIRGVFRPPPQTCAHFSPHGNCTDALVREIGTARHEILLLAYGFTSRPVAQALVDAKLRGVHVEVILDHSNESDPHSEMAHLLEQGLVPLIDAHHAIAHNKVVVIDRKTVITGSFNFTVNAETHNAENLVILRHYFDLAQAYRADFAHHREHARAAGTGAKSEEHHGHAGEHAHGTGSHDALDAVARSTVGIDPAEKASPRMTAAASEVFAKLRKQMSDTADDAGKPHSKAA